MFQLQLSRIILNPKVRILKVGQHSLYSLNLTKVKQTARCFSTTKLLQDVDRMPASELLEFENLSQNIIEPTLYSQGLGLANHWPSGYMQALLEQVHLTADVPWWGAIVASK